MLGVRTTAAAAMVLFAQASFADPVTFHAGGPRGGVSVSIGSCWERPGPRFERREPPRDERRHEEPEVTTVSSLLDIDGTAVRATVYLWRERGEVRSRVVLDTKHRDGLPEGAKIELRLVDGKRDACLDMDRVGDACTSRRAEFASCGGVRMGDCLKVELKVRTRCGSDSACFQGVEIH